MTKPGWIRGALGALLGAAFGFALVVALRKASGLPAFQTEQTGCPQVVVPLVTGGCFDYWLRWASGMPTIPEDHSQHGAKSWRAGTADLLRTSKSVTCVTSEHLR